MWLGELSELQWDSKAKSTAWSAKRIRLRNVFFSKGKKQLKYIGFLCDQIKRHFTVLMESLWNDYQ